jgi:hypothetical protein
MPPVGSLSRQHHFTVTGQFQLAGLVAVVQNIHAPNLNPIRADGDSSPQGNSMIRTLELNLVRIKHHIKMFRRAFNGLTGGRPKRSALAVLQIDPRAPRVEGGVAAIPNLKEAGKM